MQEIYFFLFILQFATLIDNFFDLFCQLGYILFYIIFFLMFYLNNAFHTQEVLLYTVGQCIHTLTLASLSRPLFFF